MASVKDVGRAVVFGGSGFLGRRIVEWLAAEGIETRVAVRHPEAVVTPEGPASVGEIHAVYADVRDESSVALAIEGCDAVVNAVGLYVEQGSETFEAVHEPGAMNVAHRATARGIARLTHISGIGADLESESSYVRARAKGDLMVKDACPSATILCPSVIFSPDDTFVNTLAEIAKRSPVLPLFGSGATKLQPVYIGDVAAAVVKAIHDPNARGKTYELGGPRRYSYRALIELVLRQAGRRRLLLPVPFPIWDLLVSLASVLPHPPLTRAQVTLMKSDNVVGKGQLSLADLGVEAKPLEDVLTQYVF